MNGLDRVKHGTSYLIPIFGSGSAVYFLALVYFS